MKFVIIFFVSLFMLIPGSGLAELRYNLIDESTYIAPEAVGKVVRMVRMQDDVVVLDGRLDEDIWDRTKPIYDFVQSEPDFGYAPTEQTEIKIVYDNRAVYFGVRLFDSRPDKIVGLLTRPDTFSDSDFIIIYIDSQLDRQTAYCFGTNPYGVKVDYMMYNDSRFDGSWDAVWEVETTIDSLGWTAEYKIPFSVFRYSPARHLIWGFNARRTIMRKQERDYWVVKPRGESGFVSRFGFMVGAGEIKPVQRLEFMPYATNDIRLLPQEQDIQQSSKTNIKSNQNLGVDIKWGLGSNSTLDLTVNPDFGQVEADPSVLNLGVYETFFRERRPFFLEGSQIFDTPFLIFHSRRIGKRPKRFDLPENDKEIERPEYTTILTAAKITGRNRSGLSYGVLDAITRDEFALVNTTEIDEETGSRMHYETERLVEPMTNYWVGRVRQDLFRGRSYIGGIGTSVNRMQSESNYVGAVDWKFKTPANTYSFSGQVGYSKNEDEIPQDGYAATISLDKISGRRFEMGSEVTAISPGFDINDLGFLRRNNRIDLDTYVDIKQYDTFWIFRFARQRFRYMHAWNYDGLVITRYLGFYTDFEFENFWDMEINSYRSLSDYDDLDTRGGPPMLDPPSYRTSIEISTDDRKTVELGMEGTFLESEAGGWSREFELSMAVKPTSNLWFSINPTYSWGFSNSQWVKNVDDNSDGTHDHFVFGELKRNVFDVRVRTNLTLSRKLSIQFFMQPYVAVGQYQAFKELAKPKTYIFYPYFFKNPDFDFNKKTLKSNAVLRWEYMPGSTLYLVWTQSRKDELYAGDFDFSRDFRRTFIGGGKNIFMLKLNYWLNL